MIRTFFISLLLLSLRAGASETCDVTKEYKAAHREVIRMVYGEDSDYRRCQKVASETEYWKALSKCVENGDGKYIGGGCAHLVGGGRHGREPDNGHCEAFAFQPSPELVEKLLDEVVREKNIEKCSPKRHQPFSSGWTTE